METVSPNMPLDHSPLSLTTLVTGASSGFGLAIAQRFLAAGHRVVACARRRDPLRSLAARFQGRVLPLQLDVTDSTAIESTLGALLSPFKDVDVLVNNAGLALGLGPAQEANTDAWDQMIATNCRGLVHVTVRCSLGW